MKEDNKKVKWFKRMRRKLKDVRGWKKVKGWKRMIRKWKDVRGWEGLI